MSLYYSPYVLMIRWGAEPVIRLASISTNIFH
jgi:hypothetical protein